MAFYIDSYLGLAKKENPLQPGSFISAVVEARVEENTNLNIPKLLEVKKYASRWALTTEYIEGTTLDKLMIDNPEKQDEYLDMFVKLQLQILQLLVMKVVEM